MRVRTLLTLTTGAALGAGAMYLLDPVHGPDRRRQARRAAVQRARGGARQAVLDARRRAEELAAAAASGYRQGRVDSGNEGPWT